MSSLRGCESILESVMRFDSYLVIQVFRVRRTFGQALSLSKFDEDRTSWFDLRHFRDTTYLHNLPHVL
jgi:hypothetical protein